MFSLSSNNVLYPEQTFAGKKFVQDTLQISDSTKENIDSLKTEVLFEKTYASWYGHPYHGRKSASGEIYNMYDYTCAIKTNLTRLIPFGTILKITNLNNSLSVNVRVNDTGPLTPKRKIDLSYQSMLDLEGIASGEIPVKVEKYY